MADPTSPSPTSPRAVNIGHSPLLAGGDGAAAQQQQQQQQHAEYARQHELIDAKRKFSSCLESSVLDYLHYHPTQLEDCVKTLHTLFTNIVTQPDEPKFRKIKAANKAYLKHVASVEHTEELLLQAGWRPKVVDLEKSWVFEAEQGSYEFRLLQEAGDVLLRALNALHAKAERKRKEEEERKNKHSEERERIRLALEDDRRQRKLTEELTAARSPAGAPT